MQYFLFRSRFRSPKTHVALSLIHLVHRSPPEHLTRMILHRSQACDVRGLVIALPDREGGPKGFGPPRCGCALRLAGREGTNLAGAVDMLAVSRILRRFRCRPFRETEPSRKRIESARNHVDMAPGGSLRLATESVTTMFSIGASKIPQIG